MSEMQIVLLPLEKLVPYAKNARLHTDKQITEIAASIREFGFRDPVEITGENTIIAGHGRILAAKLLGLKSVPCIVHGDMDNTQWRAYNLVNNRLTENSEWDTALLSLELKSLQDDFDLEELGFDLSMLEDDEDKSEYDESIDEIDDSNDYGVVLGDIWELGTHRLMCGDSTNIQHVEKLMNGEKADMVFTDPPYGMNVKTDRASMAKSMAKTHRNKPNPKGGRSQYRDYPPVIGDDQDFDPSFVLEYFEYCKEIFLFGADYYAERLLNKNDGSWIVWDKHCMTGDTKSIIGSEFELCWSKQKHRREIAKIQWIGGVGGVKDDTNAQPRKHPTQKPVQIPQWFIERYGKEKDIVSDLYMGAGSTLIACEKTKRKCFGMEIDPHYCSIIIGRWEKYTGEKAKRL